MTIDGSRVALRLALTTADAKIPQQLQESVTAAVEAIPGVSEAAVKLDVSAPAAKAMQADGGGLPQTKIAGVKHVIAVASGKGGVWASRPSRPTSPLRCAARRRASAWASAIAIFMAPVWASCSAPTSARMRTRRAGSILFTATTSPS